MNEEVLKSLDEYFAEQDELERQGQKRVIDERWQAALDYSLSAQVMELYKNGVNVFPIKPRSKHPFILKPLFYARMLLPAGLSLFDGANAAVMLGRTSRNLLALDCDTREAFEQVLQELDKRSILYWAYTSARGGGVLLRLLEGEAANTKAAVPNVEIWGSRHFVVVPPSIHPSGVVYRWLIKTSQLFPYSVNKLAFLGVELKTSKPQVTRFQDWKDSLSWRNRKALDGVPEGERNIRLFALACDLKGIGVPYHFAEEVILASASRCTPSLPEGEALTLLKSAYSRNRTAAREYFGSKSKSEGGQNGAVLLQIPEFWKEKFGRKALTRKQVFRTIVEAGGTASTSLRRLAIQAGMSLKTVHASVRDLCRLGVLEQNENKLYVPNLPHYLTNGSSINVVNWEQNGNSNAESFRDVFKGLGKSAEEVYRVLAARGAAETQAEIARAAGLKSNTVSKAIKRLMSAGLVFYSKAEGGRYCVDEEAGLYAAAKRLGVEGWTRWRWRMFERETGQWVNKKLSNAIEKCQREVSKAAEAGNE
jgi:transcription initiation factor IIE alpha subunit